MICDIFSNHSANLVIQFWSWFVWMNAFPSAPSMHRPDLPGRAPHVHPAPNRAGSIWASARGPIAGYTPSPRSVGCIFQCPEKRGIDICDDRRDRINSWSPGITMEHPIIQVIIYIYIHVSIATYVYYCTAQLGFQRVLVNSMHSNWSALGDSNSSCRKDLWTILCYLMSLYARFFWYMINRI